MAGHHRNKDDSCVVGGDRTGLFYFSPGFSPLCLVSLVVCLPSQPIRHPGTTFYRREFVMELPTKHQSLHSCAMVCMEAVRRSMAVVLLACLEYLLLLIHKEGSCSNLCCEVVAVFDAFCRTGFSYLGTFSDVPCGCLLFQ